MAHLLHFQSIKDHRGTLSVVEKILPFNIKRVFYIYGMTSERGGHRHISNQMVLIALGGSVSVLVKSPEGESSFELTSPDMGLYLAPEDWHLFDSDGENTVLLALCSHEYDKNDYIIEAYS